MNDNIDLKNMNLISRSLSNLIISKYHSNSLILKTLFFYNDLYLIKNNKKKE